MMIVKDDGNRTFAIEIETPQEIVEVMKALQARIYMLERKQAQTHTRDVERVSLMRSQNHCQNYLHKINIHLDMIEGKIPIKVG